jgi:hypothetical protein
MDHWTRPHASLTSFVPKLRLCQDKLTIPTHEMNTACNEAVIFVSPCVPSTKFINVFRQYLVLKDSKLGSFWFQWLNKTYLLYKYHVKKSFTAKIVAHVTYNTAFTGIYCELTV